MKPTKNSLVLYKQTPAVVNTIGEKIDICLPGGKSRSVREKDVITLHPGPVVDFPDLESNAPAGHPADAWELLQGESPSLADLADLVYGEYTPATAWMTFKLLNRTPWFRGTPDAIEIANPESVAHRIRVDQEKTDAESRWTDFLQRFKSRKFDPIADELFLRDLEMYTLGKSKGSRILKAIGKTQSPENAHRVMLSYGAKDMTWNPHPLRLNVPLDIPNYPLGDLPQEKRKNLTNIEAYAIDDAGNTDPDDAISWDGEVFWVHVADVAALLHTDTEADAHARERASSLYLPEKTVPMLPPEAAARLGLGLDSVSPALSYAFRFDANWNVVDFSIHISTVRVIRLSYAEADSMMHKEPFATMQKITSAALERRIQAGAISISLPEVKIQVDKAGEIHITPLPELESRKMVTEAMLMTGSHAAAFCRDAGIPIPFTVQETDLSRTDAIVESSTKTPGTNYVAEFDKRKGMKRSRTSLEPAPHGGLGLEVYSRVTSPLRRYPDLITSRQIRHHILGEPIEDAESIMMGLAAFELQVGNLVQAERRSNLFWKLQWLQRRPKWQTEAWLVDRRDRYGLFLIPEIALETRVSMKKDIDIGSQVILALKEVDIPELSVLFVIQEIMNAKT